MWLNWEVDPQMILLDITSDILESDDDGGAGCDSRLTYTLSSTGRYYVLVMGVNDDYGGAESHF